ncbi:MAG: transporter, partial [Agathobacter sp.]|nr:transporter [Agathobacter sp.]
SNGIQLISQNAFSEGVKYILAIQALSFGGLSGLAQTASLLETSGLSTYKYIIGKVILSLLLTLLSVIYVSCFILQP